MQSEYIRDSGTLIIYVPKELDHHQADRVRLETDTLIEIYHIRHVVFDFSQTDFMDSSGIGVLIGRSRNMGYAGGDVRARNLGPHVDKIFTASGLKKIIPVE